jgi:predicted nucleic acid-binding protein
MVIGEMVYVLRNLYGLERSEIAGMLEELLALPEVIPVDEIVWSLLLQIWPEKVPDFTDAALTAVMMQGRYDAVATFDQRFRRRLAQQGMKSYW